MSEFDKYLPELLPISKQESIEKKGKTAVGNVSFETQPLQSAIFEQKKEEVRPVAMEEGRSKLLSGAQQKNQYSKNLITEMMNKISSKKFTEEKYPVSNETVNRLILGLEQEIIELTSEVKRRENSLIVNSNNHHLKHELDVFEKNLKQVKTIKDLYNEQIESRNKIAELEYRIIDLKSENRDLKVKISRGIEKIESHIHHLPCEKEKTLYEEVKKYKMELDLEKEMRQNLEANIKNIVLNFKRLSVEAENARTIVVERLRSLEEREEALNAKIYSHNASVKNHSKEQKIDEKSSSHINEHSLRTFSNISYPENSLNNKQAEKLNDKEFQRHVSRFNSKDKEKHKEKQNEKQPEKHNEKQLEKETVRRKDTSQTINEIDQKSKTKRKNDEKASEDTEIKSKSRKKNNEEKNSILLEDQIEKMRSNQLLLAKAVKPF